MTQPDKTGEKLENRRIRDEKGRFVKGHPDMAANSKRGRPRKAFHELIDNVVSEDEWERVLKKALAQAKKGNDLARKFLADHRFGKPVQKTEVSGPEGGPIAIDDPKDRLLSRINSIAARTTTEEGSPGSD